MDEMIYCLNSCSVATCLHHPGNIGNPELPHKQAHLYYTEYCPLWRQEVEKVEVVRCKDCKFWDKFPTSTAAPDYHHCGFGINVNWYTRAKEYCSRGERRDG